MQTQEAFGQASFFSSLKLLVILLWNRPDRVPASLGQGQEKLLSKKRGDCQPVYKVNSTTCTLLLAVSFLFQSANTNDRLHNCWNKEDLLHSLNVSIWGPLVLKGFQVLVRDPCEKLERFPVLGDWTSIPTTSTFLFLTNFFHPCTTFQGRQALRSIGKYLLTAIKTLCYSHFWLSLLSRQKSIQCGYFNLNISIKFLPALLRNLLQAAQKPPSHSLPFTAGQWWLPQAVLKKFTLK